jgi:hypothetical protein
MRYLIIEVTALAVVGLAIWYGYRTWLNSKEAMREAYFSGGPLHDHTEMMTKYTKTYLYTYNKPELMKANDQGIREEVSHYLNALYEHQGDGTYAYKGSVPIDKLMQYDEG